MSSIFEGIVSAFRPKARSRWSSADRRFAAAVLTLEKGWSYIAFESLVGLAKEGHAKSQFRLGEMYERAEGIVQNLGDAVYWFKRSAEQGSVEAQARLGLIYLIEPPTAASLSFTGQLQDSTSLSEPRANPILSPTLGQPFEQGFAVKQNVKEAARWNTLAAASGHSDAQVRMAHQYATGLGVHRDLARAETLFRTSSSQGNLKGQAGLGAFLCGCYGNEPNYDEAVVWLRPASDAGNSLAQFWLGCLSLNGNGVPQNCSYARELLESSASQGYLWAIYQLGIELWSGERLGADSALAESWLRRGALRGETNSMRALAQFLFERGEDEELSAVDWLRKCAEAGDKKACAMLAECHLHGKGATRDPCAAAYWLAQADNEARHTAYTALASFYSKQQPTVDEFRYCEQWLLRAAQLGSIAAQFTLGSFYLFQNPVSPDFQSAAVWYDLAQLQGHTQAAFYSGLIYLSKENSNQDSFKAASLFEISLRRCHSSGLCNIALMKINGLGHKKNVAGAIRILEDGAFNGCTDAAILLAEIFSSGEYVVPDLTLSVKYLSLANSKPDSSAASHMKA